MSNPQHATYHGPVEKLQGESCIIRDDGEDSNSQNVWVQFDNVHLTIGNESMAGGWHSFARKNFHIEE